MRSINDSSFGSCPIHRSWVVILIVVGSSVQSHLENSLIASHQFAGPINSSVWTAIVDRKPVPYAPNSSDAPPSSQIESPMMMITPNPPNITTALPHTYLSSDAYHSQLFPWQQPHIHFDDENFKRDSADSAGSTLLQVLLQQLLKQQNKSQSFFQVPSNSLPIRPIQLAIANRPRVQSKPISTAQLINLQIDPQTNELSASQNLQTAATNEETDEEEDDAGSVQTIPLLHPPSVSSIVPLELLTPTSFDSSALSGSVFIKQPLIRPSYRPRRPSPTSSSASQTSASLTVPSNDRETESASHGSESSVQDVGHTPRDSSASSSSSHYHSNHHHHPHSHYEHDGHHHFPISSPSAYMHGDLRRSSSSTVPGHHHHIHHSGPIENTYQTAGSHQVPMAAMMSYPTFVPYGGSSAMFANPGSSFWPRLQSGRLYREEYAMLLVVLSLAGFLGLLLASTMPYALLQAQNLNTIGVPGGTVHYTNALGLPSNQLSPNNGGQGGGNVPLGFFGKRRKRSAKFVSKEPIMKFRSNQTTVEYLNLNYLCQGGLIMCDQRSKHNKINYNLIVFKHHQKADTDNNFNLLKRSIKKFSDSQNQNFLNFKN